MGTAGKQNDALSEQKKVLRKTVAARRKACGAEDILRMSRIITHRILQLDEYRRAKTVFAYMSIPGEVQTRDLLEQCIRDGKRLALPRVSGVKMHFYEVNVREVSGADSAAGADSEIDADSEAGEASEAGADSAACKDFARIFVPGYKGIPEPDPDRCRPADDDDDALVIMPGVAFDRQLNRIGYGGGYYDRYLREHPRHPTLAAAFGFQIFESVPQGSMDIRPNLLVSESGIFIPGKALKKHPDQEPVC